MIRSRDRGGGQQAMGRPKTAEQRAVAAAAPVFELETDVAARRRREKQKQRDNCAAPLRAHQALSRGKKTEEYAHLRVRRRQSAEDRKRSLHTNGSASKSTTQLPQPQQELKQPHTSREPVAISEARAARAALDRQRPQSAKPKLEQHQHQHQHEPPISKNAITGKLINVRHWEAWLCHAQPTTASQLAVSQSSPTLGRKDVDAVGEHSGEEQCLDRSESSSALLHRTSIVVDMRRLRLASDQREPEDSPEAPEVSSRPPLPASRRVWGEDGDDGGASRA